MLLRGRVAALLDPAQDAAEIGIVPCISYTCKVFYDKMAAKKEYEYLKDLLIKLNFDLN